MSASRRIVVVGAGPAGVSAAMGAKEEMPSAAVTLISGEDAEPYERPPLSKEVLRGDQAPPPIVGSDVIEGLGINFVRATRVRSIDRGRSVLAIDGGHDIPYDALVLATGSVNRLHPLLPPEEPGIHYLRTQRDAFRLRGELRSSRRIAVVGGGLIGLEVAASAAALGLAATVIEVGPRILSRVLDEAASAHLHQCHESHGVEIQLGAAIRNLVKRDGACTLELSNGAAVEADLILVGVGAAPEQSLALQCGLAVDEGILVDRFCRTSDPGILAAGDVARFADPHGNGRLENWRHAQEQGFVAGRNAAGADTPYMNTPTFWTEQYELYIQGVGSRRLHPDERIVRRHPKGGLLFLELNGDSISYAAGFNVQREISAIRRIIEKSMSIPIEILRDETVLLSDFIRTAGRA